jgi:hypothetical protein
MADATRHAQTAKHYYGMLMQAKINGKNPTTGQPVTPEELETWQKQADGAKEDYFKIAGKAKAAKPIIQQMGGLLKHITGQGGQAGQGGQQGAPGAPAQQGSQTVPAPPQGAATPQQTVPPPPNPLQEGATEEAEDAAMKSQSAASAEGAKQREEESGKIEGMVSGLKAAGFNEDQIHEIVKAKVGGAAIRAKSMHPVKVSNPDGTQVPALQDPTTGEVFGPDGTKIDNPTIIPTSMMETQHTGEMPVYNPDTGQFEQQPTHSTSKKVMPGGGGGKAASSGGKSSSNGSGKGPSSGAGPAVSGARHGIPARQFNILQKQATAIDEARNALAGPDPTKSVGGLAADLSVFDNPDSVKRISEYLGLVNSQIANEAKTVAGQGAWAAAEWYIGLPQAVIGLQQGALADASRGLSKEEQRFVADYYRVLGTIGGMRAATGASSAQWSYNTLRGELPTPGPVTSKSEAARRVNNFIQETNVVSKRNPLLGSAAALPERPSTVPPPPSGKAIYAKDPQGVVHQAAEGTPLPKGWTLTDAPAAK